MKNELFERWMQQGNVTVPKMLLTHYSRIGLSETECMLILQLHSFLEDGNVFPTPSELSERMTIDVNQTLSFMRVFIQKGFLSIQSIEDKDRGVYAEKYSLQPLWNRLLSELGEEQHNERVNDVKDRKNNIFVMFETEFGRPLSPMEIETVNIWMDEDNHPSEMIGAALKEGVLAGKLNFRYIDRILFEWKKAGVITVEQARVHGEKFRTRQQRAQPRSADYASKKDSLSLPAYNWLDS
ncbi:DnaD domain-containing protein [Fictibacillus iocasae]|uniref:DnaD domain-containing protein n=1 Tax=Fictibacillus iocasae TaxID=2715437 RepID=A0ABW2NN41_9BACL